MAFKPAEREVILKLSQPRFIGVFFALDLLHQTAHLSAIVQKLLQLQSLVFWPELSLRTLCHNYNLFHGTFFLTTVLVVFSCY